MLRGISAWLRRRRAERAARRLLEEAFRDAALLQGTSLRPRHSSRWVLLDHEVEGDAVVRIRFGILRHPRPYAFSRQSHKVIEDYLYDVRLRKIERLSGLNVTRSEGRDADDG
jgi:hypothetical protein